MAAALVAQAPVQAPSLRQNRTFIALCLAQFISVIGDGFHSVALGLWVLQTTGSSTAMGTVMTVRILTTILLGAVAGTAVDRSDRRRLMIAMDVVRVALVGALAFMVRPQGTSFALVLLMAGLASIAGQFFNPAFQASLVNIVRKDDLSQASGLLQVLNTLGQVAGPLVGGMVVGFFGGRTALMVDAATFAVSALLILVGGSFASPRRESSESSSFFGEMRDGLSYIKGQPLIRSVATLSPVLNFFGMGIAGVLIPVLAVKVWMASSAQYGALEGVFPLGFAIGAISYMAVASKVKRRGLLMMGTAFVAAVFMTIAPLMPTVVAAMPFGVLAGAFMAVPNVMFQVLVQSEAPPEVQGRIFGVLLALSVAVGYIALPVIRRYR